MLVVDSSVIILCCIIYFLFCSLLLLFARMCSCSNTNIPCEGDYNMASQKGMSMGSVRHADGMIVEPYIDPKSQSVLTLQAGKSVYHTLLIIYFITSLCICVHIIILCFCWASDSYSTCTCNICMAVSPMIGNHSSTHSF